MHTYTLLQSYKHTTAARGSPPKESRVLQVSADDLPQLRLASHECEVHEWNLLPIILSFTWSSCLDLRSQSMFRTNKRMSVQFRKHVDLIRIIYLAWHSTSGKMSYNETACLCPASHFAANGEGQASGICLIIVHEVGPRFGQRITGTQVEIFSKKTCANYIKLR